MSAAGSVTHWITQLKARDDDAAQALWERYFRRLVERARRKLAGAQRRAADEEDVALSAFDSFCRAATRDRFPRLNDRHDLWQLLLVLSDRKAKRLVKYERRQRRGEGKVLDEAGLRAADPVYGESPLHQLLSREPDPAFVAQVAENCQRLLARLGDEELRSVALWKMEGYTNDEIAAKLGCVPRTVERKLGVIRKRWKEEIAP